jgi:itaconate CoA-transferase
MCWAFCRGRSDAPAPRRHHRRLAGTRHRRAVLHAPARRPGRARDQGRAPRRGDFARAYDSACKGLASHFVWTNRSKESLTLDLKQPRRLKSCCSQLLENADVLVQNLAPGAAARMGWVRDALSAPHPKLIVCDISGYGDDGPYRDKKAYDLLIQSEAGFLSVTGTPETRARPATRSPTSRPACTPTPASWRRCCSAARRAGQPHRRVDARIAGRVDGLPAVLRVRRRTAAAAHRRLARHIYPYGPFQAGDGKHGDAGPAERARVEAVLRQVLQAARRWPPTRALTATRSATSTARAARADPEPSLAR